MYKKWKWNEGKTCLNEYLWWYLKESTFVQNRFFLLIPVHVCALNSSDDIPNRNKLSRIYQINCYIYTGPWNTLLLLFFFFVSSVMCLRLILILNVSSPNVTTFTAVNLTHCAQPSLLLLLLLLRRRWKIFSVVVTLFQLFTYWSAS